MENTKVKRQYSDLSSKIYIKILIYILLFTGAIYLGYKNFSIYHTIVELFGIIIGFVMAIISINTYRLNKDNRIIFLGIAFGFIACFNLIHVFTYDGMNVFGVFEFNLSIQMWLIGRYFQNISLLICFMSKTKKYNLLKVFFSYLFVSILSIIAIFYFDIFPNCYVETIGFTTFKLINGYINSAILLFLLIYFIKNKRGSFNKVDINLILFMTTSMLCELFFVTTSAIYDIASILAHLFQLLSFYYIYVALVQTSLRQPYYSLIKLNDVLLSKNENLRKVVNKYEIEHKERMRKQQILNGILESVEDGVLVINDEQKVLHANTQFRKMLEIPFEITSKTTDYEIIDFIKNQIINKEEFLCNVNKGLENQEEYTQYIYLNNGKVFEISSAPFKDNRMIKGKLIVCRDITEKRKIEELQRQIEIRQASLEKAKEFDELKTDFFCTVSHELKTPINIILGVIQLLSIKKQSDIENNSFSSSKYIKMMKQNCYRLIKLSNNLIDITKIDAGYTEMKLKNHNIVCVIEDITFSVAEYIKIKDISLVFDTDVEEKIMACDDEQLERVMLNLLSNAVKFTEAKGNIEVNIKDKDDFILISVKDDGIGIPENKKDIVFDRFRQVDSTLRRKKEGSGIGLALVKAIIEKHGGIICLKSKEGKGSEFIIKLPVYLVEDSEYIDDISETKDISVERINIEFSDIYELNLY